jgi:hypothetical protein
VVVAVLILIGNFICYIDNTRELLCIFKTEFLVNLRLLLLVILRDGRAATDIVGGVDCFIDTVIRRLSRANGLVLYVKIETANIRNGL